MIIENEDSQEKVEAMEPWNYDIFLVEYNKEAQAKRRDKFIFGEHDEDLEEQYKESSCMSVRLFAQTCFYSEQMMSDISPKYMGSNNREVWGDEYFKKGK